LDVQRRVTQRFTLEHARRRHGNVQGVCTEALLRDFERGSCSRTRLVKEVHDRLSAKRRNLLDGPFANLAHGFRGVQHAVDLVAREIVDAEQILLHSWSSTSSRPSVSMRCTCTLCDSGVGMFLPT